MPTSKIPVYRIGATDISYSDFSEQLQAMSVPFYQEAVATEGQQVFTVNKSFRTGTGQLQVYVDGMLQKPGEVGGYVELNSTTIMFNEPLAAGTEVIFRIEGAGSGMSVAVNHTHIWNEVPGGAVDGTNRYFTLNRLPLIGSVQVIMNGIVLSPGPDNDYIVDGSTIIFNEPPPVGAVIKVNYII